MIKKNKESLLASLPESNSKIKMDKSSKAPKSNLIMRQTPMNKRYLENTRKAVQDGFL